MKILNLNIFILYLVYFSIAIPSFSQEIDLRMVARKDCAANTFCATIQLKSGQGNIEIGTSDFMLSYEPTVLAYRDFLAFNYDKSYHPNSAWDYCAIDSQEGLFHLTAELIDPNGVTLPISANNWRAVGTVCFDILQHNVNPQLEFMRPNLQVNRESPNDGTAAIAIGNTTGITQAWRLSCVNNPEIGFDFFGEAGSIYVEQPNNTFWHRVVLKRTYNKPIVVANLSSYAGIDLAHIRVRNVEKNSFEFKIEEWDNFDGSHILEKVDYLVVEEGTHQLTNGAMIQAGKVESSTHWQDHVFPSSFSQKPILATQVTSENTIPALTTRIKAVNESQFALRLQYGNNAYPSVITPEDIHWIAMQPTIGKMGKNRFFAANHFSKRVGQNWVSQRFTDQKNFKSAILIGQRQTTNDEDASDLRFNHLTARGVEVKIEEVSSNGVLDRQEQVGYMLFEEGMLETEWTFGYPPEIIGEAGKIEISQENATHWHSVTTTNSYQDPVVVAQVHTFKGNEPIVTRVRKVNERQFDIMIQEWPHYDEIHTLEEVSWVIMEAGTYTLPNGKMIKAGTVSVSKDITNNTFETAFNEVPKVVTQVTSGNSWIPVIERVFDISQHGFRALIERQEKSRASGDHPPTEDLDYIAIEPTSSSTGIRRMEVMESENNINHNFQNIQFNQTFRTPPVVLADMQTRKGSDVAGVRIQQLTNEGFQLKIEEEKSRDEELAHIPETVAYMAFEEGIIAAFRNDFIPCIGQKGKVLRETWLNIPGHTIQNLISHERYPHAPNRQEEVNSIKSPSSAGKNQYGTRIRGFITPPLSGYFNFNVTGDDHTYFYLSTDVNPENTTRQAYINGYTSPTEHNKYNSQTSQDIYLTAGRMYYFELLHKEGVGGDHYNVFWKWGNRSWNNIKRNYLYSYECYISPYNAQTFSFDVTHNGEHAALYWSVKNEVNSDYFQIQTAAALSGFSEESFEVLGIENGSGNGTSEHPNLYHFDHYIQTETEARYYRIAQVHLDGSITYSPIRSIYLDRSDELVHVYPNPFTEMVTLVFPDKLVSKSEEVHIEISNVLGQVVYQAKGDLQESRVYELTLGDEFKAGIYQVAVLTQGVRLMSRQVVKVK